MDVGDAPGDPLDESSVEHAATVGGPAARATAHSATVATPRADGAMVRSMRGAEDRLKANPCCPHVERRHVEAVRQRKVFVGRVRDDSDAVPPRLEIVDGPVIDTAADRLGGRRERQKQPPRRPSKRRLRGAEPEDEPDAKDDEVDGEIARVRGAVRAAAAAAAAMKAPPWTSTRPGGPVGVPRHPRTRARDRFAIGSKSCATQGNTSCFRLGDGASLSRRLFGRGAVRLW